MEVGRSFCKERKSSPSSNDPHWRTKLLHWGPDSWASGPQGDLCVSAKGSETRNALNVNFKQAFLNQTKVMNIGQHKRYKISY